MEQTCKGCGTIFQATNNEAVARWLGAGAVGYCAEDCWAEHTMPTECPTCYGIVGSTIPGDGCTCTAAV